MNESIEQVNIQKKPSRRKYILVACIVLLLITPVFIFILLSQNPKSDPASEKILRAIAAEQLNMDMNFIGGPNDLTDEHYPFTELTGIYNDPNDMTDEDFAKVLILNLRLYQYYHGYSSTGMELRDIKLLEKFTNLQKLNLGYFKYPENAIPEWMKFLAKHGIIDIRKRLALDLSPLKKLSSLQELYLGSIFIKDIKPLIKLKNLQILSFEGSSILDFESIKELTNLHRLNISNIHIPNLKPLKELINLEELYIYDTLITDLEPLNELINLKNLYLTDAKISNLEPLKKLIKLEMINLHNTQISNIEPLGNLTNLQELNLNHTKVIDIEPLTALENLERLEIRDCPNITDQQVEDLQKALPNLQIIR